eukprot:1648394-Amphidinium_carterae.1
MAELPLSLLDVPLAQNRTRNHPDFKQAADKNKHHEMDTGDERQASKLPTAAAVTATKTKACVNLSRKSPLHRAPPAFHGGKWNGEPFFPNCYYRDTAMHSIRIRTLAEK